MHLEKSPIVVLTTQYRDDPVSTHRAQCAIKTLDIVTRGGFKGVIVDGGSNNLQFLEELYEIELRRSGIRVYQQLFKSHGEQIHHAFVRALELAKPDDIFFYLEPEKYGLLNAHILAIIKKYIHLHGMPKEFLSLMRDTDTKLPHTQLKTESETSSIINSEIDKYCGYDSFSVSSKEDLIEGVGNLFGPFLATLAGVEKILQTGSQSERDGNEFLFVARILSLLEGIDTSQNNIEYLRLAYCYDFENEVIPEQEEWENIRAEYGVENLDDFKFQFLDEYAENHPHSIIVKRFETQKYIKTAVLQAIKHYCCSHS